MTGENEGIRTGRRYQFKAGEEILRNSFQSYMVKQLSISFFLSTSLMTSTDDLETLYISIFDSLSEAMTKTLQSCNSRCELLESIRYQHRSTVDAYYLAGYVARCSAGEIDSSTCIEGVSCQHRYKVEIKTVAPAISSAAPFRPRGILFMLSAFAFANGSLGSFISLIEQVFQMNMNEQAFQNQVSPSPYERAWTDSIHPDLVREEFSCKDIIKVIQCCFARAISCKKHKSSYQVES